MKTGINQSILEVLHLYSASTSFYLTVCSPFVVCLLALSCVELNVTNALK